MALANGNCPLAGYRAARLLTGEGSGAPARRLEGAVLGWMYRTRTQQRQRR